MDEMWSLDNLVFGSGGGLLQDFTRDTQRFALKCSAVYIDGEWRDVFKPPSSDPTKRSKRGRLKLTSDPLRGLITTQHDAPGADRMSEVFRDGVVLVRQGIHEIRERAEVHLPS